MQSPPFLWLSVGWKHTRWMCTDNFPLSPVDQPQDCKAVLKKTHDGHGLWSTVSTSPLTSAGSSSKSFLSVTCPNLQPLCSACKHIIQQSENPCHCNRYFSLTAPLSPRLVMTLSAVLQVEIKNLNNFKDYINTTQSHTKDGVFKYSFCSISQWEFVWQARQQPNPITSPRCHMSSFRRQEMDELHFAAHNICRGKNSTPQRAGVAVLKLSIVSLGHVSCLFGRPTGGLRAEGLKGSEEMSLILNIACLQGAVWVSVLADRITKTW